MTILSISKGNKKIKTISIIMILVIFGLSIVFFLNQQILTTKKQISTKQRPSLALTQDQKQILIQWLKERPDLGKNVEKELIFCYDPTIDYPEIYKDLMKILNNGLNVKIVELYVPFHETLPALDKNVCDVGLGITPTEERKKWAAFSDSIYQDEALAVNKDNKDLLNMLNLLIGAVKSILGKPPR